ncbi:MAG: hypothetical protein R3D02_12635 [Hyphomicrobiales bacterium]
MFSATPPARALGAIAVSAALIVVMIAAAASQFGLIGLSGALALVPLAVAANALVRFDRHLAQVTEACRLAANTNRSADFTDISGAEEFNTLIAAVERLSRRASQPADSFRPVVDEAIRVCHAAAAGDLDHRIVAGKSSRAVCNDLARAVNRQIDVADLFARELLVVLEALAAGRTGRRFATEGLAGRHAEIANHVNAVIDRIAAEHATADRRAGGDDPAVGAMLVDLYRAAEAMSAAMRAVPNPAPETRLEKREGRLPIALGPWGELAEVTRLLADRAVTLAGRLEAKGSHPAPRIAAPSLAPDERRAA